MINAPSTESRILSKIAPQFLHALDCSTWKWCILHSYENGLNLDSDIDIAISRDGFRQLDSFLLTTCREDTRVVQRIDHEHTARYYVIYGRSADSSGYLKLDFCTDYRRNGRTFLRIEDLLRDLQKHDNLSAPRPAIQAVYMLVKKILKGDLPQDKLHRIRSLYRVDSGQFTTILRRLWDPAASTQILRSMADTSSTITANEIGRLRHSLLTNTARTNPFNPLTYWIREAQRLARRLLTPSGYVVVLLGPDGTGKSTLAKNLSIKLVSAFRRSSILHWRPGLFPNLGRFLGTAQSGTTVNPHSKSLHGRLFSIAVLIYYWLDFVIGYWVRIYPQKARSSFIVFDRYFPDFIVDPTRYRLKISPRIAMLLYRLIPAPDFTVVLAPDVGTIRSRKQELPLKELLRQSQAFNKVLSGLPNSVTIGETLGEQQLCRHVEDMICDRLHRRFLHRHFRNSG